MDVLKSETIVGHIIAVVVRLRSLTTRNPLQKERDSNYRRNDGTFAGMTTTDCAGLLSPFGGGWGEDWWD